VHTQDLVLDRVSLQLGRVVLVEGEPVNLDGHQRARYELSTLSGWIKVSRSYANSAPRR
jgi:hypothetical protein